ncbi:MULTISPECIES: glycoside hydrolase family 3 C-terminal domain-containing protein [Curtobacterium]|uniref:beta-glucosidase H n=1 Tax=Curtobacterium flaccumfaciens TaxID=2035 RepID=UPI003EE773C5
MNTRLSADQRADLLVKRLTLDQKIEVLVQTGGEGVPEYGIPAIRGKDASNGIGLSNPTTALPVGLALASTFDDGLAEQYGAVAGREARASGFNSAAAPSVDLARNPWNGRGWESAGEDPLLTGNIGTAEVQGIQSERIPAEVKHYNVYNQESRRAHVDAVVDERTLQEVYTRPWEKIVQEAQPGSVMCSFNKINGEYGCGNKTLLNDILKEQLGAKGFVQSDFNAAHSLSDYAAGLDTSGETLQFSSTALKQAVVDGTVAESTVTASARRVLWSMFQYGIIDSPPPGSFTNPQPASPTLSQQVLNAGDAVSQKVGAAGTVLLKNDRSQLPLTSRQKRIAVIGSDADAYIDGGGSASVPTPAKLTTIVDGITARAGGRASVQYSAGTDPVSTGDTLPGPAPVPSTVLQGVQASYWLGANTNEGDAFTTRHEPNINLRTGLSNDTANTSQLPGLPMPLPVSPMTARYTGTMNVPTSGAYGLSLSSLGTSRLYLDDQLVLENDATSYGTKSITVPFRAGKPVSVRVDYTTDAPNQFDGSLNDQAGAMIRLGWTPPAGVQSPAVQQAVALAKRSDVAVVVARDYTGEAADRGSLTLPQGQDALISAVAAANPHTVVVLATSGAVLMPWLDKVPSVIEAWYGGQSQGKSVASVLWGDVNPSGRLPITFPATEEQPTAIGVQNSFKDVNVLNPTTTYADGVNIGYRGYAAKRIKPLFPFGSGLSYTTFDYSKLKAGDVRVDSPGRGGGAAKSASISVEVRNAGRTAGTETVQVYVGKLPGQPSSPTRALAGYARVDLQPGKKAKVDVELDKRSLQYWDTARDAWVTPRGSVPIYVGSNASDVRLAGSVSLR